MTLVILRLVMLGERALNRVMAEFGGFDHNAQSLKHVTHARA